MARGGSGGTGGRSRWTKQPSRPTSGLVVAYGPPQRYMGFYETEGPHDRRRARRLRDPLLTTLRMARFQPRVSYQLLELALRQAR